MSMEMVNSYDSTEAHTQVPNWKEGMQYSRSSILPAYTCILAIIAMTSIHSLLVSVVIVAIRRMNL